ncbi:MAG: Holliday junction resolvase RuvX [bacterium]|nr:Holliday junction resolvase RuvX [bacterium]
MQYLGIDYGAKHIGMAIGDDDIGIASPWKTIEHTSSRDTLDALKGVIKVEGIDTIVVGIPTFGSARTEQRRTTEEFIHTLQESVLIPVETADESFTSLEAQRRLGGSTDDHAVAAMLILQSYLDKKGRV